jgi:hypothetical protein
MQAKILLTINPFSVPDHVTLVPKPKAPSQAPAQPLPGGGPFEPPKQVYFPVPLAELDGETLHRLCEEFRDGVFRVAGKPQPPEAAPPVFDLSPVAEALRTLRANLCDPAGRVCLSEVFFDDEEVADALDKLALFLR